MVKKKDSPRKAIMDKMFNDYRQSIMIKDHVKCRHIIAGEYSYYSGFYHRHSFEGCVMYLDEKDNSREPSSLDRLIIGKFCAIATGAKFMLGGTQGHNYEWIASYPLDLFDEDVSHSALPKAHKWKGDTILENDVWIGAESLIMPGVHIADGAVIAARAVVTKNVGPYEIWGGNPARLIKKRFSAEEILQLLEMKWWDWNPSVIKLHLSDLRSKNVHGLYAKFKSGKL